jgi:lipopolysaccharide export system permease protein
VGKLGLKTIDRYIIKKFLGTFFFSLTMIMTIVIVFDVAEKIDNFMENHVSWNEIIFVYYINFIPYFANFFSPLFVFISVIFFTSKLTGDSEIVAILTSGVSFRRLMYPYFISALFLGIISFFLTSYIIPNANKKRIAFELKYVDHAKGFYDRNVHKQIEPGVFAYLESYDNSRDIGYKFSIEKFEGKKLVSKLFANRVKWDSTKQKWTAKNYYIRDYIGNKEKISNGSSIDTMINLHPKDFKMVLKSVETLNVDELKKFIEEQKMKGDDNIEAYKVEEYRRMAFPFSTFILTLIGVSLSTQKRRGGTGLNIGIGLVLSFLYILFMQVFTELAKANTIPSLIAVWIPNILFFGVGVFLYLIAPK